MPREIKFRCWDGEKMQLYPMLGFNERVDINEQFKCAKANGKVLMQFTGLKDKNGKEIYEGDIIGIEKYGVTGVVEYLHDAFIVRIPNKETPDGPYRLKNYKHNIVMGNIYENPKLLT